MTAPCAMPFAKPALLTVAVAGLEELQVAELVRFWVVPSANVPVAVNCWFEPTGIEGLAGVIAIEVRAGDTVKVVHRVIEPEVAVMVLDPAATPVANPVLVMVAAAPFDELHVTELVRLLVVPLE